MKEAATKINDQEQWPNFNNQIGQNYIIRCTLFSSERQTTVVQRAFQMNSVLAAEENWHLKHCTLGVKNDIYFCNISKDESICELE